MEKNTKACTYEVLKLQPSTAKFTSDRKRAAFSNEYMNVIHNRGISVEKQESVQKYICTNNLNVVDGYEHTIYVCFCLLVPVYHA